MEIQALQSVRPDGNQGRDASRLTAELENFPTLGDQRRQPPHRNPDGAYSDRRRGWPAVFLRPAAFHLDVRPPELPYHFSKERPPPGSGFQQDHVQVGSQKGKNEPR